MIEAAIAAIWPYVLGALALVVGWFTARQTGKSAGRQDARIEQLEADAKARGVARDAAAEIERLDDDAVRERARERMHRNQGR